MGSLFQEKSFTATKALAMKAIVVLLFAAAVIGISAEGEFLGCFPWIALTPDRSGPAGTKPWSCEKDADTLYVGCQRHPGDAETQHSRCKAWCQELGTYDYYNVYDNTACFCHRHRPTGTPDAAHCSQNRVFKLPTTPTTGDFLGCFPRALLAPARSGPAGTKPWSCEKDADTLYYGCQRYPGNAEIQQSRCKAWCWALGTYDYYNVHDDTACFCHRHRPTSTPDAAHCSNNRVFKFPTPGEFLGCFPYTVLATARSGPAGTKPWSCEKGADTFYVGCQRHPGDAETQHSRCQAWCQELGTYDYYNVHDDTACFCHRHRPTGTPDAAACSQNRVFKLPTTPITDCPRQTVTGTLCKFPFVFQGTEYTDCTAAGDTKEWCATETFEVDGVTYPDTWGHCRQGCGEALQMAPDASLLESEVTSALRRRGPLVVGVIAVIAVLVAALVAARRNRNRGQLEVEPTTEMYIQL